jgi:hypothetical protein
VALYGAGRFWIEGLRIDPAGAWFGLRLNQWMSVAIIAGAIAILLLVRGARQVFVMEGGKRVTVDWDSPRAEASGYTNGALPKGGELPEFDEASEAASDAHSSAAVALDSKRDES